MSLEISLVKLEDIQLQPLRISTGWNVVWNQFFDIYPNPKIKVRGLPNDDVLELFNQDLLQLKNEKRKLLLDLGWIPEADPEGTYELTLVHSEDWDNPVATYKSKDKDNIVEQINLWLRKIAFEEM